MKALIAPNSFKESLTATEAAARMAAGLKRGFEGPGRKMTCEMVPLSDGGDGFLDAVLAALGGRVREFMVAGPFGPKAPPVRAEIGFTEKGAGRSAVIEMASASGLRLVSPGDRNPLRTTTFGTGEMIRAALDAGCRTIYIGLGGSATNDGGAGMAVALGARLLDASGGEIPLGAAGLKDLRKVDLSGLDPRVRETEIVAAYDVTSFLTGPLGASRVFGPQKGATGEMVEMLDRVLEDYARLVEEATGKSLARLPGAGAAGGLGFGLAAFLGAKLAPGARLVMDMARFDERLEDADVAVTGEGRFDSQSSAGKAPQAVLDAARSRGIPALVIAGSIDATGARPGEDFGPPGTWAEISAICEPMPSERALKEAGILLEAAAERAGRWLALGLSLAPGR